MPDLSFIFATNALATLIASGFIYIAGTKRLQSSIWFVYNALFCIWNFCLYQAILVETQGFALFWVRASFIPLIFIAPVFLHFLSMYSDKNVFRNKILTKIYILFFLVFVLSFVMPREFIRGIETGASLKYVIEPGPAFAIFAFIFIGFIFCGFFYLARRAEKIYLTFRRNQRIWIFFGMILGMLAPLGFLLSAYGINFFSLGLFCVIPYLAITGYTIAKYHVPEADILFKKAWILAYTSVFVILLYIGAMYIFHHVIGIRYFESSIISGVLILLNILFTVHYGGILRLNKIANNIVYKRRLAYYNFLENFNFMMKEEKDLYTLLYYIVDSLKDIINAKCVMLYLFDEDRFSFKLEIYRGISREAARGVSSIPATSSLVEFLREGNIYVPGESKDFAEDYNLDGIKKDFDRIKIKLTVPLLYSMPLYHGRGVVAILNLGDKKNSEPYTPEDIDILNAFGRELSICLDKAKLFTQAISDDLTKLYRYNYFQKRLDEELERGNRYNRVFSLILVDVDEFKKINDVYGHRVGDEVLKKVASIIRSHLRKVDIAARYGGEEFGILLPETNRQNALIVAERLRKTIEEEFGKRETKKQILKQGFSDGVRLMITVSMGVSAYSPGVEKETLIKIADKALYRAKWEGRNRVCSETKA